MRLLEPALLAVAVGGPAFLLAIYLVPLARGAARRLGALDEPGYRKLHELTMPRTGGVAVYSAFVATVGVALDVTRDAHMVADKLLALLVGATLAFATGLADDMLGRRFPVAVKALGQIAAAVVVMSAGVRTSFMPAEWLNWLATLLWLVGITSCCRRPGSC